MKIKPIHLIFEGAELSGKSWLMSQIYNHLEPKYNQSGYLLDGCHWFNCDVGIFGTPYGQPVIAHYLDIFEDLKDKNLLIEKFYLSDVVYNRMYRKAEIGYNKAVERLKQLDFKIILITFPEDEKLLEGRIKDRLNLYPHYQRVLKDPQWYTGQQREYLKEIEHCSLPVLTVETNALPDQKPVEKILEWIGES